MKKGSIIELFIDENSLFIDENSRYALQKKELEEAS